MKKASWIVLLLPAVATLLLSLVSAYRAYWGGYLIGPARVTEVAAGRAEVLSALRGIRGTSAAFAFAYGVLLLAIVLGPYRKGETWAWWAILAASASLTALVALRIPLLGTSLGVAGALTQFGLVFVGLLLDVGRLKGR